MVSAQILRSTLSIRHSSLPSALASIPNPDMIPIPPQPARLFAVDSPLWWLTVFFGRCFAAVMADGGFARAAKIVGRIFTFCIDLLCVNTYGM